MTKPKRSDREPEPPPPPEEGPPSGPPVGAGGEEPPEEMTQVILMTLNQMRVMMRNQITQRPQKNQVFCMMKREGK